VKSIVRNVSNICPSEVSISEFDSPQLRQKVEHEGQEISERKDSLPGFAGDSSDQSYNEKESKYDSFDNEDDGELSEYERLHLKNIRRNEACLVQLGLLAKTTNNIKHSTSRSQTSIKQRQKKNQTATIPRRSLPKC